MRQPPGAYGGQSVRLGVVVRRGITADFDNIMNVGSAVSVAGAGHRKRRGKIKEIMNYWRRNRSTHARKDDDVISRRANSRGHRLPSHSLLKRVSLNRIALLEATEGRCTPSELVLTTRSGSSQKQSPRTSHAVTEPLNTV